MHAFEGFSCWGHLPWPTDSDLAGGALRSVCALGTSGVLGKAGGRPGALAVNESCELVVLCFVSFALSFLRIGVPDIGGLDIVRGSKA